jgi:hypothetical protein
VREPFADHEKGPDPRDPSVRRRNVRTLLAIAALVALVAVLPGTCRRFTQPDASYPTASAAVADGAVERGAVPRFVPAEARDIHVRHNPRTGRRFVRFDYDTARVTELTATMRPVPEAEKERVPVPGAGWAPWFPVTERTLSGRQGEYLTLFEVPAGPDRGWLALDPRTQHAYYWSPGGE